VSRSQRAYQGRTLAWDAELEKKVGALGGDAIPAAMRRHIDPAKMTMVKAGDFARVKAASAGEMSPASDEGAEDRVG
jgi:zinc protease